MSFFKKSILCLTLPLLIILSSCTGLLFYPQKQLIRTPADIGLTYENVQLKATDGTALHGWWLPAKGNAKGSIYFLHGNAENISTHIGSVYWLPEAGYNVFLLDYRGYGSSEGTPTLPDVFQDIDAGMEWFKNKTQGSSEPRFILGQSLGASLSIYYVGTHPDVKTQLNGLVIDASLASYHEIAREKLASFWVTWPFQYPMSWLLPERYSPDLVVARIAPLPLLMFHSRDDEVIPYHHGQTLFALAREPKQLITTSGAHITTFSQASNRERLLQFFQRMGRKE